MPTRARADLVDDPWVMEPIGTAARQWATTLSRDAGFEPDARFQSSDLLLHARLVETGHAAALLPDLVWRGEEPAADLLPLPALPARRIFTLVRRGATGQPAVQAVRQALADAVGELSGATDRVRRRVAASAEDSVRRMRHGTTRVSRRRVRCRMTLSWESMQSAKPA